MGSDTTAGDATAGAEERRLEAARDEAVPWRRWGPYLSERQWGTVREDDSADGSAWESFPHDHARSRAYRWGEDGLAGFCDDKQRLCFALALWNGADPILKERLFGLTNGEGNHGEDVKEYYFYLDATPTSAYLKYLYKYPQVAYPYADLVATNRGRSRHEPEYELLDTGAFAESRYFDVFVEYAKAAPEEILVRITVWNRGPEAAPLEVLPTLWFRNTWAAPGASGPAVAPPGAPRPELRADPGAPGAPAIAAVHPELGTRYLLCEGEAPLLFTENETNAQRLFGTPNRTPFVKDGINDCVVGGRADAVNPAQTGTKAAARYRLTVAPGASATLRLRLTTQDPGRADRPDAGAAGAAPAGGAPFGAAFDGVVEARRREADAFYAALMPPGSGEDAALVMRQALAGMLWSAQYYGYDLDRWLGEHAGPPPGRAGGRNREWGHMLNDDVVSMPDKWEYPWYAAWDLAFHAVPLALADPDLAKRQLELLLGDRYQHPSGALPAYEWAFDDVNPPVHAWAALFVYDLERERGGQGDRPFLRRVFHKLLLNFTWWVNRKDPSGRNVFQGGFLGLDNIGVFDRSAPLPTGGHLEQADGTAWMAFYCQSMLAMALELANDDPVYEDLALKFFEHFLWIAAMNRSGDDPDALWDEADGFYYDVLRLPDGSAQRLKVRSLVGLLPLCAATVLEADVLERFPALMERVRHFVAAHPALGASLAHVGRPGAAGRRLLSALDEAKLRRVLGYLLDEGEFLGPHGIRAVSRVHADRPFVVAVGGQEFRVDYEPAESTSGLFGGNSNWRGPVWFPINALLIRALRQLYAYYGDDFTVECPTGSGRQLTLYEVSRELAARLEAIFLRDATGRRPVHGGAETFQTDPHWRDLLLFYEYFHGDNGAGIGASHQTGWTGLVAALIRLYGVSTQERLLAEGPRGGARGPG